jgi:hypothetical protein
MVKAESIGRHMANYWSQRGHGYSIKNFTLAIQLANVAVPTLSAPRDIPKPHGMVRHTNRRTANRFILSLKIMRQLRPIRGRPGPLCA